MLKNICYYLLLLPTFTILSFYASFSQILFFFYFLLSLTGGWNIHSWYCYIINIRTHIFLIKSLFCFIHIHNLSHLKISLRSERRQIHFLGIFSMKKFSPLADRKHFTSTRLIPKDYLLGYKKPEGNLVKSDSHAIYFYWDATQSPICPETVELRHPLLGYVVNLKKLGNGWPVGLVEETRKFRCVY